MRRANDSLRLSKEERNAKSEGKRVGREAAAKWRKVYGDPSEPSQRRLRTRHFPLNGWAVLRKKLKNTDIVLIIPSKRARKFVYYVSEYATKERFRFLYRASRRLAQRTNRDFSIRKLAKEEKKVSRS